MYDDRSEAQVRADDAVERALETDDETPAVSCARRLSDLETVADGAASNMPDSTGGVVRLVLAAVRDRSAAQLAHADGALDVAVTLDSRDGSMFDGVIAAAREAAFAAVALNRHDYPACNRHLTEGALAFTRWCDTHGHPTPDLT